MVSRPVNLFVYTSPAEFQIFNFWGRVIYSAYIELFVIFMIFMIIVIFMIFMIDVHIYYCIILFTCHLLAAVSVKTCVRR